MFDHRFFEYNEHDWKVGDGETCESRTEDGNNQSGVVIDRDQELETLSGLVVKTARVGRNQARLSVSFMVRIRKMKISPESRSGFYS
jgi:hypothetical protein